MAQIVTVKLVENNVEASEEDMNKLRLRNTTFSDALGVFGSQNTLACLHRFLFRNFISR